MKLSKFLKPNLIALVGVSRYWSLIGSSPYLIFLTYLSFFVSNSVFELIVRFLDDHGICRGFDLVFFISKFPFSFVKELFSSLFKTILLVGDHSDLRKTSSLLLISIIIYLFVSLLGEKWEIPIDTNRTGFSENHVDYSPTFFLQMNFSVFTLSFISTLIRICGVFWDLLLQSSQRSPEFSFASEFLALHNDFSRFSVSSSSFKEVFFAINNSVNPFFDFYQNGKRNSNFFPAIICWTLTTHFINWLIVSSSVSNSQPNYQEIGNELEKSGTYLDGIRPGKETKKLVSRVVNVLVILWASHLTLLAMCFDNAIFSLVSSNSEAEGSLNLYNKLPFLHLLITTSAAIDLSKQVKKKYDYSKFYD